MLNGPSMGSDDLPLPFLLPDYKIDDKPYEPTPIYRTGSGNATNLTPREVDNNGLSYSLIKPEGQSYTKTTIEAIYLTGKLKATIDGLTHVSITPIGLPIDKKTMQDWIKSRATAKENPHELTLILQEISTKGN